MRQGRLLPKELPSVPTSLSTCQVVQQGRERKPVKVIPGMRSRKCQSRVSLISQVQQQGKLLLLLPFDDRKDDGQDEIPPPPPIHFHSYANTKEPTPGFSRYLFGDNFRLPPPPPAIYRSSDTYCFLAVNCQVDLT